MHQEAQAQVLEADQLEVSAQPPRGPQPLADRADDPRAGAVVAEEEDAALVVHAAGLRLAEVVEERAEAKRGAAVEPVGELLAEDGLDGRGVLAGVLGEVALDREQPLEDLDRVPVGVEVVVRVLLDAAQVASSSGSTTASAPSSSRTSRPRTGSGPAISAPSSASRRSPAGSAARPGDRPRALGGGVVDLQAERGGEAGGADQRAAGRRRKRRPRPRAGCGPRGRRGRRAGRSGPPRTAARRRGQRHRHRVDREVAGAEVRLDAVAPRSRVTSTPNPVSPAATRQVPKRSESANACPPSSRAIARAASSSPAGTARSRSVTGRSSRPSRTAPPTTQASAPASAVAAEPTASRLAQPFASSVIA